VVQWSERGFGFIELEDGRRAYVHASQTEGGDLQLEQVVNCVIEEDARRPGKWAAKQVQSGPLGEDGEVVEWNQKGGFGFLSMDDGRRAYIHASFMGGGNLEVGRRLRVRTKPDPRNAGKWCVAEVKSEISWQNDSEDGGLQPISERPEKRARREAPPPPETFEEASCTGSVVQWDERGFGFVQLEDGRRAYVHHSAFGSGNLLLGEQVFVTVAPDRRNAGKWMVTSMERDENAVNSSAMEVASLDASEDAEDWIAGTILDWHEDSGTGSIELDDGRLVQIPYGIHGAGSLWPGQRCEAKPVPDVGNMGTWLAASLHTVVAPPKSSAHGEGLNKQRNHLT